MRLFSRNKEAVEPVPADDVPFEALRRSPRNTRKPRSPAAHRSDDPTAPLDPTEASKTRARRRLIGAVALGLAAVVFVPMLFDRTSVPPADDIGLQIPDRDSPFEGRRGVPDAVKAPLRPSSELPQAAAPVSPVVESGPPQPDGATVEPVAPTSKTAEGAPSKAPVPATKSADKPAEKTVGKAVAKVADKPVEKVAPPATDDPRAVAALEGKADGAAGAEAGGPRNYVVQIAAFSAVDKAKGLRDQLVANGLKSYTESVSTAQGLRTRVRLGPFTSREAADRAKQKLKTMKLDGSVVPL